MMSMRIRCLLAIGKEIRITPSCCYSSDPKQRNISAGEAHGSVHLPNNVQELDAGQKALFSPERSRDISGPNIDSHGQGATIEVDRSHQAGEDAHVGAYACSGSGIHLDSVMQPNVPRPFESASASSGRGDRSSYVDNPPEGGHWTGGEKYVAEDRKLVHARGGGGSDGGRTGSGGRRPGTGVTLGGLGSIGLTLRLVPAINNHILLWQHDRDVLLSRQAFGVRPVLPVRSTPCLTYCTSVNKDNPNAAPISRKDKLKKAVKDYGATVIVFHVGISLLSLGGFYLAVSSGLNVVDILNHLGMGSGTVAKEASTFAVAYIVHKAFAPVRISITLGATPFIVRYLRRVGILKPPK
ncbi:uncharacterized protein LOC124169041 [Ischnura elegans]|uniref:uncharacterized protein LOC124169041 n=1 Tax=Ischnura elegans TaxID=197161 RepID=UPI001ED89EBA|nr:uncharacterized protein LOC124169041 [Ischnura elegans]XP_046403465.1 uncharacterized protein LOC124169041 [Ischnura elegans]